ncbi:TonB-dependent receptor domain-containing protein [Brevundimonas sp. 2YAF1]|uniref:TonB-dependent receptor domain-containing protein n=1 Tax=Brevundimonas sp. 2YAF1 TaxID=3233024 RepID=UPI003F931A89
MLKSTLVPLMGSVLALPGASTLAQTPPSAPPAASQDQRPAPAPEQDQTAKIGDVVVTARANAVRTSIDAVSYSLANDLQAATGTLAEALRNVPSVDVDPNGNVSLRGDPGVTILVDGRPSALLSGESRAQAVQSLPAAAYSRIEVMTNPSAAYSPEGSGGVINLITKPVQAQPGATTTATTTGSVQANVGDSGRYSLGVNLARTRDRLTLTADAGLRHDPFDQTVDRLRARLDAPSRRFLEARQTQAIEGAADHAYLRLGAEYRVDAKTQLTGELRYTDIDVDTDALNLYEADAPSGGLSSAWRRRTSGGYSGEFVGATGRVLRRFNDQGHEWSNELRLDRVRAGFANDAFTETLAPVLPPAFETVELINNVDQLGLTSAYTRPMADGGKLRAGYDLRLVSLELDNRVRRGPSPSTLVQDSRVSNDFHVDEAVHALYATWERPFGAKLSAQAGLRLEQVERDLDQTTSGMKRSTSDFNAYPTMHVSYALSDGQSVRASYGRRVQRPRPSELNPFLTYQDPLNYSSGNPDLKQQETDSFELMWQRRVQQTFYQATLYYRDTSRAFTPVTTDLGGGVLLTRPENLGARTDLGLELVANGRLHPTLRYNASVNLFRQEIDASNIPGGTNRSSDVASGRLSLNWQPTSADFIQVSTVWTGEQLLAQGTRDSTTLVNLGYRRKLTESLSLQATVRDVFDNFRDVVTLDTPEFRDRTERWMGGRTGLIGLTWTFGRRQRPQDPSFDFSAPQTGG